MWMRMFQLACLLGLYLQATRCHPPCILNGLRALCTARGFYWVPTLSPNITHLYVDLNYISEINSTSLRDYVELQELDLGMQRVTLVLKNNAFLRQSKLTQLNLGNNVGLTLEPRAFAGLFNLQILHLYHCSLNDSILSGSYLQPLLNLEMLDLFGNQIVSLQPGQFFSRLTKFSWLNLKLNQIKKICKEDLDAFRGKYFTNLNLESNHLYRTSGEDFDWEGCGNPFKGMGFDYLDLSINGLDIEKSRQLFKAIQGTPINHLKYTGHTGKGFSYNNLRDPDESTFEGLNNSRVTVLDLSKSYIFSLQRAVFSPLNYSVIIDISQNKINQINRDAFGGLQGNLRLLNLSFNLLGEIYSHTFTNLTQLRVLDLSHNHIGVLGHEAFSGLPKLRALYLTGNSLRDLGFPASLPNLEYLLLNDNKLESVFNINKLGMNSIHVDIAENRLTDMMDIYKILADFENLLNLFSGGNFLRWCNPDEDIAASHNNSLQVLDLHDSSLQTLWSQGICLNLFDHLHNLLGLNISLNSLATLPRGIFSGLSSIYEIDLSSNALTYLQVGVFPDSLKILDLSNNFLASPDPASFRSLSHLSLSGNRFHCDCHMESFLKWLNMANVTFLSPVDTYQCEFPDNVRDLPLLDYYTRIEPCEGDDEKAAQDLKFALFIFSALLISSIILSGIIYSHLRGHIFVIYKKVVGRIVEGPKLAPPANEILYDTFFCFSNKDYRWVEVALLKKLDNQFSEENMFRCCFEARDFLPGEDHLSNIRDAIWRSRKTLCIVSKEFLKDGWCLEGFTLAQGRMLEELTNILIMLVVGKVTHYQLMRCNVLRAFVQRREYLVWPEDLQDMEWFYERLVSQILKDTKVKKFAEDNPEPAEPEVQPDTHNGIQLENIKSIAL
ncbi:toll-like receptor 5 isoform X2 [Mugil cephalus]|nr:toll-like receptor 5 isoform X2 [Mugil cephalus]